MLTVPVLGGLRYGPDRSPQDDTGHSWRRVCDWIEPSEAEQLVTEGVSFVVQRCLIRPERGRAERFKRDVGAYMVTSAAASAFAGKGTVPTVMVGELWRSKADGDLLVFVEQGPFTRSVEELEDDW